MSGSAIAADALSGCPIERARYVVRDERGITAGFVLRQGAMFFFVHRAERDMTNWFQPATGPAASFVSTTDITASDWRADGPHPLGDLNYTVTDANDRPIPDFRFHAGVNAPAHVRIPRLQEELLYGFVSDSRDNLSLAFLDFDVCAPR
jgi:hypothetical protein